jgi:hypothetical protein
MGYQQRINDHLNGEGPSVLSLAKPSPTSTTAPTLPIPQSLEQLIEAGSEEIVREFVLKPMAAAAVARVSDRPQLLKDAMALMVSLTEDQTDD